MDQQLTKRKNSNWILGGLLLGVIVLSAFAWPASKTVVLPPSDETVKLKAENATLINSVNDLKQQLAEKEKQVVVAAVAPKPVAKTTVCTHVVKKGETLWVIAQKELGDGSKYMQIVKDNNLANADSIEEGTELIIKK